MARYIPLTARTVNQINAELQKIKLAIDDTLSRKGDSPNTMEGSLDMNSNRVLNLQDAILDQEPMTLSQGTTLTTEVATEVASYVATNVATNVALEHSGWIPVSFTFASGGTLTGVSEIIIYNGGYWRWDGALPKTVTAGSSPTPVGVGSWLLVSGDIDNSKHAREFGAYSDMIANADYSIAKTGQKVSTGGTSWRTTTTATPVVIANTSPQLYAKPLNGIWLADFGIVENTDFSAALRLAVSISDGTVVNIPAKRYLYDRAAITTDNVNIRGALMPKINSGYTGLEGGTIIQGTLLCTGKNVTLKDFGVDLGTATGESDGDGIKCRYPTINTGGHLHTENLIALLPAPSTPSHALLFESYQKHTGGNLTGAHGFFSFVNKCQNVQLSKLFGRRSSSDGIYFKSDATDGKCAKVNIDGISVEGGGGQTFGLRIQSAGDFIEDINITNVVIDGCARPYKADCNGTNGVGIRHIKIANFTSKNASSRDIHIENAKASGAFIYDHKMTNVSCIDTLLEGYKADGAGVSDFIDVDGLFISYKTGVSSGQMNSGGVQIGANVLRTKMDKVVICQNWSVTTLGGINYSNQSVNNQLGMYTAKINGSMPLSGDSSQALSGATATLVVPAPAWNSKTCNARITLTADTIVTTFTENVQGAGVGALFENGTLLTVINNSTFNLTINHNFGGNILNRGGVPYVLASNEAAQYVYGGAVWHQV